MMRVLVAGIASLVLGHVGSVSAAAKDHSKVIILKPTGMTESASLKRVWAWGLSQLHLTGHLIEWRTQLDSRRQSAPS